MINKSDLTDYFLREWIANGVHFIEGLSKDEVKLLAHEHVEEIERDINDNRTTS